MTAPRYWFVSDTHFDHARVIEYCRRPFANVDEMNETLITNWNATVGARDFVYLLGDVALTKADRALRFVTRLKGRKHLVFGNHDKPNRKEYERSGQFEWCKDLAEIKIPDPRFTQSDPLRITLCHFPLISWNQSGRGAWHLHGHCHGTLPTDVRSLRLDVGVDVHGYAPVSLERVAEIMATRAFKPVDHHGAD
mgnify:CR=1 FL=1